MKSLHSVVFYLALLFVSGKADKKKESEKNVPGKSEEEELA